MDRLGKMQESRRCAGGGEGRGDLAADVPRLAQARDNQLAFRLQDQAAGFLELVFRAQPLATV